MSTQQPLLIRADATVAIGTGHVMRCIALAQAWQQTGASVTFIMATQPSALQDRIRAEGFSVLLLRVAPGSANDAEQTAMVAHQMTAAWIVADGYCFDATYQHILKEKGHRVLLIDDYGHAEYYFATMVLNQNISADEKMYIHRESSTRLLLGTQYALLRREFWPWRGYRRAVSEPTRKILVTLGGSDPDNVTLMILHALYEIERTDLEVVVVVGGSNPYYETLHVAAHDATFPVSLRQNVTNMPELMAWAEIAVTAGGSTCWETAFMGLPNIILVLAQNQEKIAAVLDARGVAINLGWATTIDPSTIATTLEQLAYNTSQWQMMSENGQRLVDGYGAARVVALLQELL